MFALGDNMASAADGSSSRLVLPYLVVLLVAYVGSRVVYGLGAEVSKAREMGSYRLVERLGKGGMGEVWRAQHRLLARPAAIKLIRPEVLGARDPATRELLLRRFEREAQATALMRSPHTMELYDFGVADDGTFYYVMELLDGFDLDDLVERFGPVPPERAVHLLRQVCASLGEAHEAGLIHRDVKPANLYACRYGREVDFIKVLDFGLVKHGAQAPGTARTTSPPAHMSPGGTPAYMSPEQALGEGQVDGADRPLRRGVRRLLAPDRLAGLQGRHRDGDAGDAREPRARAALTADHPSDSAGPGRDRARVPGQESRGSPPDRR